MPTAVTPILEIGYLSAGDPAGVPVVLLHGFPYDVRSYEAVTPLLAEAGARVIVPYLRGYGPTRFRSADTMRSGQQAALGQDLIELMDALGVNRAVVGGYDWGGRAACVTAALHPERVLGLVTAEGYLVQDLARALEPGSPQAEKANWYQHYFQTESGRIGLARDREALCGLLWRDWSPTWRDAEPAFRRSAPSLHNPDFVEVAIHSYRHRRLTAPGDPAYDAAEARLAAAPPIAAPTVVLSPADDGFGPTDPQADRAKFTGPFEGRVLPGVGHNPPQEDPAAFAEAVRWVLGQAG
ncbi:alpha/beta fold hydrolase [Actinoplanes sp. NPDC049599]|uniref:alpha/beta fold hydrolase n=1 Tax=Actinoplanes sp. NPDC049599 TaxID=3363903 RepID=UPI003789A1BB